MRFLCVAEVCVTHNSINVLSYAKQRFYGEYLSLEKKYLNRQVKCPIFLPYFNQISIFSADFHRSPQYKISRKSVQTDDGHGEANKRLSGFENGSKNVHLSHSRQLRHIVAVEVQPQFLNLGANCRSVVSAALLSGNNPPYPLNRRLGGPHSRSGRIGE